LLEKLASNELALNKINHEVASSTEKLTQIIQNLTLSHAEALEKEKEGNQRKQNESLKIIETLNLK
jgi:hypothetical protein